MKNIIYSSLGILAITLMSFTNHNSKQAVIEVAGKTIHVTNTHLVKSEDLAYLSQHLVGWSVCDYQSISNQCTTRYSDFPDDVATTTNIKLIIAKYQ